MKKNWIKFKEFSKKDKIFRVIIMSMTAVLLIASLAYMIYYIVSGNTEKRWFPCAGCMVVYILPYLYELIFRRRISNMIMFFYMFYSFLAGLIGCVIGLYTKVAWYDIFIHTLAGYTFAVLGLLVVSRLFDYKKLNPWVIAFLALMITLCAEYIWEIMEWSTDVIVGLKSQGEPVPGYRIPFVTDTMEDMLCNLCGGILFCIQFLIGRFTKFSFGIKFYEQELCYKHFVRDEYLSAENNQQDNNDQNIKSDDRNQEIQNK